MENNKTPKINPNVNFREEFDDWGILFNPATVEVFGLNPISALIWKNINGKNTISDINNKIKENVIDIPDDSLSQIEKYIDQLEKKDLLSF